MLSYNIDLDGMIILVTGVVGLIDSNLVKRLLNDFENIKVFCGDSITDYYYVDLKYEWLRELRKRKKKLGIKGSCLWLR